MNVTDLSEIEFTIFDTETTGLDPASDRIIELAAMRVRGDTRLATFHTLVNPGRPVSPGAFKVNGISDGMLAGASRMEEVIPAFEEFIRGSCLCAYNAPFDTGFLAAEYARAGRRIPDDTAVVDVLAMARLLLQLERHPLWFVAQHLGLGGEQEHRALSDVELTFGVFRALRSRMEGANVMALEEYISLFGRGSVPYARMLEEKLGGIRRAIDAKSKIRIKYFSRSEGRVSEREVIPREIRQEAGRPYLTGYCCLRKSERVFRIEGILRLELLGPVPDQGVE